jgi:hypothetical protein
MMPRKRDLRTTKKVKRKKYLMLRRLSKVKISEEKRKCRCEEMISRRRNE